MNENILIQGWIRQEQLCEWEYHDALLVEDDTPQRGVTLAERLESLQSRQATVRYWICDEQCSKDQAVDSFLRTVMGFCNPEFSARYSELTGYLWTDEYLKVGGHDIIEELRSNLDKWLILEIEVH